MIQLGSFLHAKRAHMDFALPSDIWWSVRRHVVDFNDLDRWLRDLLPEE